MKRKSLFDLDEYKPYAHAWQTRQRVLATRQAYYDGSMYASVHDKVAKRVPWIAPRLYRGIKALYLPLARAVDVDMGLIPGGWALPDDAPGNWHEGAARVFGWSGWPRAGLRYVFHGAVHGVAGLKIVDLREAERVALLPLNPLKFMLVRDNPFSPPKMAFILEERTAADGTGYEYGEVITAEEIRTYRNGAPFGYDGRPAVYENPQGQVPVVETLHKDDGSPLGEATFSTVIPLLNEVNSLASYLADVIKKHTEPQWAVFGAEATELEKSGANVWFFPQGADVKPLVPEIDIEGVLAFVKEIGEQVKGGLPELAFDELKGKERVATATVELQLMELVLKIRACRPNYDHGLAEALRMAARAAASMGLKDKAVLSLDDEALKLDAERPVIPLGPEAQIDLRMKEVSLEAQEMALQAGEGVA